MKPALPPFFAIPLLKSLRVGLLVAIPCAMAACAGSDGEPLVSLTSQRVAGKCTIQIDFPHDAMALYVSDLDLTLPRSNTTPTDGMIYYGLQSTGFPNGFVGPIRYGDEEVPMAMLAEQPGRSSNVVYPTLIESDDKDVPSLLTRRDTCEAGTGGCFKVGLATIAGNSAITIEDFTCGEQARVWESSTYLPPPKQ